MDQCPSDPIASAGAIASLRHELCILPQDRSITASTQMGLTAKPSSLLLRCQCQPNALPMRRQQKVVSRTFPEVHHEQLRTASATYATKTLPLAASASAP